MKINFILALVFILVIGIFGCKRDKKEKDPSAYKTGYEQTQSSTTKIGQIDFEANDPCDDAFLVRHDSTTGFPGFKAMGSVGSFW